MIIGVTGNIASGKTEVAKLLKQKLGGIVINADRVAHELYAPHTPVWQSVVRTFGKEILKKNTQEIKRNVLGSMVFHDSAKMKALENIVHPFVVKDIKKRIATLQKKTPAMPIILEAVKLLDSKLLDLVDKVCFVSTTKEIQIARLLAKDVSMEEALARIDSYKASPNHPKITLSIENSKGLKALEHLVDKKIPQLLAI